ncbi:hypothetical protein N7474_001333 [Penicillium riverlandense]|uniref:uncharacterized protein n=1 Tax=Penicillium riverlandense TaxID=1903569 RepID=UPI0025495FDB|nr:uncharacterized protein N7474_001333 [Penicillium riverlandense]KAJ5833022.1 hypothetical protein N7474_001333 [Penicillium riverlandense]
MPNPGRPSRDCYNCRQRRIKCDLKRPACGQCLRKEIQCQGYRDELEARFRFENVSSFTGKKGKNYQRTKISGPRAQVLGEGFPPEADSAGQATNDGKDLRVLFPSDHAGLINRPSISLQYPLAERWEAHSMPLVISKMSSDVLNGHRISIYNAILDMVSTSNSGSTLHQVCDAIGRVYITNTTTHALAARSSQAQSYRKAILALNSDLRDPRLSEGDETLVCVFLMSVYEQYQALLTGQDYTKEALVWIQQFYECAAPAEYNILRVAIYSYHCTRICLFAQGLINAGDPEMALSSYPSVLQDMNTVETQRYPLSDEICPQDHVIDHPLGPYTLFPTSLRHIGVLVYQSTFRLQLSCKVHLFLQHALRARACTPQQQTQIFDAQKSCLEEFQALTNQVLHMLAAFYQFDFLTLGQTTSNDQAAVYKVGLWDAMRLLWPLSIISLSALSSDWQRDSAAKILDILHTQVRYI